MLTVDFYKNLGYDFYQYEDEEELRGLTPGGFNDGDNSLNVKDFNDLELQATRDIIACYLRPIGRINTSSTSYGLKHLIERALHIETQGVINYVNNGSIILAMYDAGFRIKRLKDGSPNCYFDVSRKSINNLNKYVNK